MTKHLSTKLDQWRLDVVLGTTFLLKLYKRLEDSRQWDRAERAGRSAKEGLERTVGVVDYAPQIQAAYIDGFSDEVEAEQEAWSRVIRADASIYAMLHWKGLQRPKVEVRSRDLLAMLHRVQSTPKNDEESEEPSFAGWKTASGKAIAAALQGILTAFPLEMARQAARESVQQGLEEMQEALRADMGAEGQSEEVLQGAESLLQQTFGSQMEALIAVHMPVA